jgi:hypothetical protein
LLDTGWVPAFAGDTLPIFIPDGPRDRPAEGSIDRQIAPPP